MIRVSAIFVDMDGTQVTRTKVEMRLDPKEITAYWTDELGTRVSMRNGMCFELEVTPEELDVILKGTRKKARSSNLDLKFYVADGWTKEELDECAINGQFHIADPFEKDPCYTLEPGARYDANKLLKKISWITRGFRHQDKLTDLQLLNSLNYA